jgi:alkylation response protein AidB-like acyl-CoA dehydrogenase
MFRIKGQKIYITFGEHDLADNIIHLVLARLPDAPAGTRGISLVPGSQGAGGRHAQRRALRLHRAQAGHPRFPDCVMAFGDNDDCEGELIGPPGGGMRAMFTMMNNARMNVGLQGVSVAEAATQRGRAYARERIQGARGDKAAAIIDYPDVRRMLLRMKALTQGARALTYYMAGRWTARAWATRRLRRGCSC